MAVFLTILKILLWILLIILGIAILLILLILFAPIRYKISGELNDEKMQADAKISFLIASVKAGFTKESGLDYAARVLGIKIYPRGSGNKKPKKKTEEITSDNEEIDDSIFDPVNNADFEAWEAEHYPEDKIIDTAYEKQVKQKGTLSLMIKHPLVLFNVLRYRMMNKRRVNYTDADRFRLEKLLKV